MDRQTWEDFDRTKTLWWINRILHTFGWSIVLEYNDGKVVDAYPARTGWLGFSREVDEAGLKGFRAHTCRYPRAGLDTPDRRGSIFDDPAVQPAYFDVVAPSPWIPVNTGPLIMDTRVLVRFTFPGFDGAESEVAVGKAIRAREWLDADERHPSGPFCDVWLNDNGTRYKPGSVTHWRPLPDGQTFGGPDVKRYGLPKWAAEVGATWVPVSVDVPDLEVRVLVCFRAGDAWYQPGDQVHTAIGKRVKQRRFPVGGVRPKISTPWFIDEDSQGVEIDVSHWRPLPNPPK